MIWVIGALLLSFLVSIITGIHLIPCLKNNGFIQPLKEEVEKGVYSEGSEGLK